jgi:hypothetical protein
MISWKEHSVPMASQRSNFTEMLTEEIEESLRVLQCRRNHPIFIIYRRYRRGKHRCKYCGCKLHG